MAQDSLWKRTVGVDLGDKEIAVCVLNEDAEVMARETIALRRDRLERYFGSLERCRVALEAGCQSAWVSELIAGCGHEVLVANPWRLALISRSYRKTEKDDAEILARLGRADPALLSPLKHRSKEAQSLLSILRARDGLERLERRRGEQQSGRHRATRTSSRRFGGGR